MKTRNTYVVTTTVTSELTEPVIGLSVPDTPEKIQRRQKLYEILLRDRDNRK